MKQQRADAQVVPYTKYRRWLAAAYQSVPYRPIIHGLFEVDVTRPRAILREHHAQTGESLSFTAFLTTCLAKAVDEHKAVHAIHKGSKHLVLFEDVDIYTVIEHDLASQKYITPYIIRAANRKTVQELHHEIRGAQEADVTTVLKRFPFLFLPTLLFRPSLWAFIWIGRRYPRLWKTSVGTVGISAVGMFGNGAGWGIPATTPTTLMLTVGGIGEKQVVMDGQVTTREYLSLTISVDHDIVDGAPAARFAQRLRELVESGYGLSDSPTRSQELEQTPRSQEANDVYNSRESNLS
jgi:pyruvate/2-oxoglutarate dehydrogenase complex dihydrolipoamide acyltransferase (E2) component